MPIYITLIRWTDQGRSKTADLPDRVEQVEKRMSELGARSIGNWVTMGRFDQVSVFEAPDDETTAKLALIVARQRHHRDAPRVHHGGGAGAPDLSRPSVGEGAQRPFELLPVDHPSHEDHAPLVRRPE